MKIKPNSIFVKELPEVVYKGIWNIWSVTKYIYQYKNIRKDPLLVEHYQSDGNHLMLKPIKIKNTKSHKRPKLHKDTTHIYIKKLK